MRSEPEAGAPSVITAAPGFSTIITIYLCASFGGFVAAIADIVQKEQASAITKITSVSARHMQIVVQPIWVLLGLMLLASALCFVFQPSNRKAAFSVGIGVIAGIMTATPYTQPLTGLPTNVQERDAGSIHNGYIHLAAATGVEYLRYIQAPGSQGTNIIFNVINRSDEDAIVSISVYDKVYEQEYFQKNYLANNSSAVFPFELPQHELGQEIAYSLEIDGMPVITSNVNIQRGATHIQLDVTDELAAHDVRGTGGLSGDSIIRRLGRALTKEYRW